MAKNKYLGSALGLTILKDNPATPTSGMVARVSTTIPAHWQIGDIRGAWLADIVPEVLTASGELVTNGDFSSAAGWTLASGFSISGGVLAATNAADGTSATGTLASQLTAGKTYSVSFQLTSRATGGIRVIVAGSAMADITSPVAGTTYTYSYVASGSNTTVELKTIGGVAGNWSADNFSVKLADPDRSVKNTGLIVNGSITKAAVATGAQLMAYSGFSASNYLEQPYNANLDFGTGDFCVMAWVSVPSTLAGRDFVKRTTKTGAGSSDGAYFNLCTDSSGNARFTASDGTTNVPVSSNQVLSAGQYLLAGVKRGTSLEIWVNGVLQGTATAPTGTMNNASAVLQVGAGYFNGVITGCGATLSLVRAGATAPSADQIAHIYNTEKMLFQPNAKCTIDGTSAAVTALAYDDLEDALHVGTSWGRSKFRDLVRVESAATSTGAITSLSAGQGCHITGGAASARYYQPAMYLREELRRKEEARKALGQVVTPLWATGDGVATAFNVPKGFYPKFVYKQGLIMRDGSSNDYTISFDGFVYTVTFAAAPLNGHNICFMGVRNV